MCTAADPPLLSLQKSAYEEAIRHKWLRSEQNGYDVGDQAVWEWYDLNWLFYLRYRRLEHLLGHCHWSEFGQKSFGILSTNHDFDQDLLEGILDRLCAGQENLNIINWAFERSLDIDQVVRILESFDVNGMRIDPQTP
ncbi:MAG: hypothetical protein KDA65_02025 [Planctomycetaceae bacterium]|nr:hypothetical protein [Planctomycetaceae bacterium]